MQAQVLRNQELLLEFENNINNLIFRLHSITVPDQDDSLLSRGVEEKLQCLGQKLQYLAQQVVHLPLTVTSLMRVTRTPGTPQPLVDPPVPEPPTPTPHWSQCPYTGLRGGAAYGTSEDHHGRCGFCEEAEGQDCTGNLWDPGRGYGDQGQGTSSHPDIWDTPEPFRVSLKAAIKKIWVKLSKMEEVQEVWARADEVVTLHCDVPFAIPPNWSITWMFAKDMRTQDLTLFEELQTSEEGPLSLTLWGPVQGTFACRLADLFEPFIRKYFYLN
ncbi:hypothetical protein Q9966_011401, partial [Columba livia]